MPFKAFCAIFSDVDICDRSTGLRDLSFRFDEDGNACAPLLGCFKGCAGFWCLCRGCGALYCSHASSSETREVRERCCRCFGC